VIDEHDGVVDKFVGDGVVALFIRGFAGSRPAERAVEAAQHLLADTGKDGDDPWIRSVRASTPACPSSAASAKATRATSPPSATPSTRQHG
jgi:hypothetical protein